MRAVGCQHEGVILRVGVGLDYSGAGRPIETRIDVTLAPDHDVELIARERVITRADYRFGGVGEDRIGGLWSVDLEIVERNGARYLRIMHALDDQMETEFTSCKELETLPPPKEDGGEIGYLRARAHLLAQYDANEG